MNKELSQEIETRLQLLLTIAIFFPTLLQNGLQNTTSQSVLLTWHYPVVCYILSYVAFALTKKEALKEGVKEFFSDHLLIGLFLYVFPISTIVLNRSNSTHSATGYLEFIFFKISLYGLPIFSILTLVLAFCGFCWSRSKRSKK